VIDKYANPGFQSGILALAQAYGDYPFWIQNLRPGMNPDATWRALLVVGCLKDQMARHLVRSLLVHKDSRVRAWACFAAGQLGDEASIEQIHALNADASNRVRIHAWQAIQTMVGHEESARLFPIKIPPQESLVLVSDDSETMRHTLADLLQTNGFVVRFAASEQGTVELASRLHPQAIITDNQKGRDNLSGLNLTWDLCRRTDLRETVIFMLSADHVEPIFLWSGGDYYLLKLSANLEELVHAVVEYLHH
jgi:CheY-like chemotaxis protein